MSLVLDAVVLGQEAAGVLDSNASRLLRPHLHESLHGGVPQGVGYTPV